MRELDKVLDKKEKVLWGGKPKFWPFFFSAVSISLFGLVFMFFGLFAFLEAMKTGDVGLLLFPHFWIGLAFFIGAPAYKFFVYSKTHYAITDKRVIVQGGLIGRDFQLIDFDQITNAEVNVGVLDKLFGSSSGSILLSSAGTLTYSRNGQIAKPYTFSNVPNPYEVFKFFKKVSHDVKTDINYPNKFRPKTNPGYKTKYTTAK